MLKKPVRPVISISLGNENTCIALDKDKNALVEMSAFSLNKDKKMLVGSCAENEPIFPIRDGHICDFEIASEYLKQFITKSCGKVGTYFSNIAVMIPDSFSRFQREIIYEAAKHITLGNVRIFDNIIATASGAGLEIDRPYGNMIVDIGATKTTAAVVSMLGTAALGYTKSGAYAFDEAIEKYIFMKYSLKTGKNEAERLKKSFLDLSDESEYAVYVKGKSLESLLPEGIDIISSELKGAVQEPVENIIMTIRQVLSSTPPELAGDVLESGITLAGGGALIKGIDSKIEESTGVKTRICENPIACCAKGGLNLLTICDKNIYMLEKGSAFGL